MRKSFLWLIVSTTMLLVLFSGFGFAALTDGLVAYWPLDEASGTSFTDASGNGHTGTSSGGVTPGQSGQFGNSAYFNGSGRITGSDTGFPSGSSARTINFWAKVNGCSSTNHKIVFGYGTNSGTQMCWAGFYGYGTPYSFMVTQHGDAILTTQNTCDNTWHMFTATQSGNTWKIFVDAVTLDTHTMTTSTTLTGTFGIGLGLAQNTHYFTGYADDIAIWNRVLSDSEISEIYASGMVQNSYLSVDSVNSIAGESLASPVSLSGANSPAIIDFNITDTNSSVTATISYNTQADGSGDGDVIVSDLTLDSGNCSPGSWPETNECTYSWDFSGVASGSYYIIVDANNSSTGETDSRSSTSTVTLDNTPPIVEINRESNVWGKSDAQITLSCNEGTGSLLTLGPDINFAKTDYGSEEDCIDDYVCITRGTQCPIYNSLVDGGQCSTSSPSGTEWDGKGWSYLDDYSSRTYTTFDGLMTSGYIGLDGLVPEMILHLTDNDTYWKIRLNSWTGGASGGGFSYTRSQILGGYTNPNRQNISGTPVSFTKTDYGSEEDCITDNVCLTRNGDGQFTNSALGDSGWTGGTPNYTWWADGSCADITATTGWANIASPSHYGDAATMISNTQCLILTDGSGLMFDVDFDSWNDTGDGTGFSYTRTPFYTANCAEVSYRVDTDPSNDVNYGDWVTLDYTAGDPAVLTQNVINIYGDGNYAVDYNGSDFAGNVDSNTSFIIIGTHGKLSTYDSDDAPRSFFAANEDVVLRFDMNMPVEPPIFVGNSVDGNIVNGDAMAGIGQISADINRYEFTFTIDSGYAQGWYDVWVANQYFEKAFYVSPVWSDRHNSWDSGLFPFTFDLNVIEPGVIDRWFGPADVLVDFNFNADADSVRVLEVEAGQLLEIPSQLYKATESGGHVTRANLVFLVSIAAGETKTYYVSYGSGESAAGYLSDLNASSGSDGNRSCNFYSNSFFNACANSDDGYDFGNFLNKGGSGEWYGIDGSNINYAPVVSTQSFTYNSSSSSSSQLADENGALVSYSLYAGSVDAFDFNNVYTVYAKNPYLLLDVNVISNANTLWVSLKEGLLDLNSEFFTSFESLLNGTAVVVELAGDEGSYDYGDLNYFGVYNQRSLESIGYVFLANKTNKPSAVAITSSLADSPGRILWQEQSVSSKQVKVNDYFNRKIGIVAFNPWNGSADLNNAWTELINPLTFSLSSTTSNDTSPPELVLDSNVILASDGNILEYPDANTAVDFNCFIGWSEATTRIDYIDLNINGPNLHIVAPRFTVGASEFNASFRIAANPVNAGLIDCNFTAVDIAGNAASASTSIEVLDVNAPLAYSVTNSPDTNALIDPGTEVTIDANIFEFGTLGDVKLLYQFFDLNAGDWPADWNESLMACGLISGADSNYSCTADLSTPTDDDSMFRYLINAVDDDTGLDSNSSEKIIYSNWDWTWAITSPANGEFLNNGFPGITGLPDSNVLLGYLTIENTGDKNLSFNVTSSFNNKNRLFFDGISEGGLGYQVIINAGDSSTVILTALTSSVDGVEDDLNISIDAVDSSGFPDVNYIGASVIASSGGPFLYIDWVDGNSSVTQGDGNVLFTARMINKGSTDANTLTFDWSLPSGWSINTSASTYSTGSNANVIKKSTGWVKKSIWVAIASSASTGTKSLGFTAGCCSDSNRTRSSSFAVVVSGTGTTPPGGGTDTVGGGGKAGGAGAGIFTTPEQEKTFFQTSETFEIIRGRDENFTVKIKNPFDDRNLLGLRAFVSGLLSKYLEIVNPNIGNLGPGEESSFIVRVAAPKYFDYGKHDLVFTISGSVKKGYSADKNFTFENHVTLIVHDLTKEEAQGLLGDALLQVGSLKDLNINVTALYNSLADANASLLNGDYEVARDLIEGAAKSASAAFSSFEEIAKLEKLIAESDSQGLDTTKTVRLLTLAKLAFQRGEFERSLEVLQQAALTFSVETKGAFNVGYFVAQNSIQLTLATIALIIVMFIAVVTAKRAMLKHRSVVLDREEELLLEMIKDVQKQCFVEKKISMDEYQTSLSQYETRLSETVEGIINTQNEIANLVSLKSKVTKLVEERDKLVDELKETQNQYFSKGLIETRVYQAKQKSLAKRLSEVEKEITFNDAVRTVRLHSSRFKLFWRGYYAVFK